MIMKALYVRPDNNARAKAFLKYLDELGYTWPSGDPAGAWWPWVQVDGIRHGQPYCFCIYPKSKTIMFSRGEDYLKESFSLNEFYEGGKLNGRNDNYDTDRELGLSDRGGLLDGLVSDNHHEGI